MNDHCEWRQVIGETIVLIGSGAFYSSIKTSPSLDYRFVFVRRR